MSIKGLNDIAAQRDLGDAPLRLEHQPQGEGEAKTIQTQGYRDLLITAIPVEPLALYTFLVAGIVTTIKEDSNQHLTMRWIIFAATGTFIVAWMLASYLRQPGKQKRKVPLVEIASAVVAFAAWGLVMPESPLAAELSSENQTIWTFIITAAGAGILGLLTGSMKKPVENGN
jgi:hypothetical protein